MTENKLRNGLIAVFSLEFCVNCVTTYVLIVAVFKIRKFYKENKIMEELNKKLIVIHVLTFGIFALSVLLATVILIATFIYPYSDKANDMLFKSLIPMFTASTISQVLLCAILWQLGEKN